MKFIFIVICLLLAVPACKAGLDAQKEFGTQVTPNSTKDQDASKTFYTKIEGPDLATRRNVGMCELVKGFARGGGVYKVGTMYSVLEPAIDLPAGATYTVPLAPFTVTAQ